MAAFPNKTEALTSVGNSPAPAGTSSQQQTQGETCILCPNAVLLRHQKNLLAPQVQRIISLICERLKISSDEVLSNHRTPTEFPFCGNCGTIIMQLWEQQLVLDEENCKFQKLVEKVEQAVADGDFLRKFAYRPGSSSMAQAEPPMPSKLSDLILEGYWKKVSKKLEQENSRDDNNDQNTNANDEKQQSASDRMGIEAPQVESIDPAVVAQESGTTTRITWTETEETGVMKRIVDIKQEITNEEVGEDDVHTEEKDTEMETDIPHAHTRNYSGNESAVLRNQEPEKNLSCQVCSRLFAKKCNLVRHMCTHRLISSRNKPNPLTSTSNRYSLRKRGAVGSQARGSSLPPAPYAKLTKDVPSDDTRYQVRAGDGTLVRVTKGVATLIKN